MKECSQVFLVLVLVLCYQERLFLDYYEWGSRSGGKTLFCHVNDVTENVSDMARIELREAEKLTARGIHCLLGNFAVS